MGEPRQQMTLTPQLLDKSVEELHGIMRQDMEKVYTNYTGTP